MELIGGLLVLLVIALMSLTICAGGLCAGEKAAGDAYEAIGNQRGDKEMKRTLFTVAVMVGTLVTPAVFASQLNALGQRVPTSTKEGRSGWTAAGPTVKLAGGVDASRSSSEAAGFVRSGREIPYRIDALGRQVPAQTNHP